MDRQYCGQTTSKNILRVDNSNALPPKVFDSVNKALSFEIVVVANLSQSRISLEVRKKETGAGVCEKRHSRCIQHGVGALGSRRTFSPNDCHHAGRKQLQSGSGARILGARSSCCH